MLTYNTHPPHIVTQVKVPPYVTSGESIVVDTRTGEFVKRA